MLMAEAFMLEGVETGFYNDAEPYLNLWANKLLIHKRDYLLKKFTVPALTPDVSDRKFNASKPPEKAEFWIFIDPATGPGTFHWVCNIFGLDVERVKSKIQPDWRILYGIPKPLEFETSSEDALQLVLHVETMAEKNRATVSY